MRRIPGMAIVVSILFLSIGGLLTFTDPAVAVEPKRGGILRYGLSSEPPNFDPHVSTGTAAQTVKNQIYNGLVRYWKGFEIVPDLAESWDISADGTTYTFRLHQGVRFHDGSPFSAEDAAFSFARILDPKTGATLRKELELLIDKVIVVDPHTIRLQLKQPSPSLLPLLASPLVKMVSKSFVEKGGNLNKTLMGTGPFKFAEWQPTVSLKVVRNPDYFKKGLPYLDGITFIFYPDETARVTALRTGAVDLIDYVPWKQQAAVERNPNLKLHSDKEMLFMWLTFRTDKPPFDNPKVRQAIAWAVDRQAIVRAVFFGRGEIMTGGVTPKSFPTYASELEGTYGYDPEKAKQLLKEAGYPNGFKTRILSTFQYDMHERTGEIVQALLKEIGIEAELDLVDWPTDVKRFNAGEFEILVMGSAPSFRDGDFLTSYFHTGSAWSNRNRFSDAQIDALLDKARVTMDEKERKALYKEVEKRVLELSPAVFLCRREQAEATQKYVEGYTHIPGIYDSSLTLEVTWLNK